MSKDTRNLILEGLGLSKPPTQSGDGGSAANSFYPTTAPNVNPNKQQETPTPAAAPQSVVAKPYTQNGNTALQGERQNVVVPFTPKQQAGNSVQVKSQSQGTRTQQQTAAQPQQVGGMTAARFAGGNPASQIASSNATATQQAAQGNVATNNTIGQKTTPSASGKVESYVDILNRLNPQPSKEDLEKEAKQRKREAIINAIGDGISSLSNLYFTTQYAPNAYNPKEGLSAKAQARWDKIDADRKEDKDKYLSAYLKAVEADRDEARADRQEARENRKDDINIQIAQNKEARDQAAEDRAADLFAIQKQLENNKLTTSEAQAKVAAVEAKYAEENAALDKETKQLDNKLKRKELSQVGSGSRGGSRGGRSSSGGASGTNKRYHSFGTFVVSHKNWTDDKYVNQLWSKIKAKANRTKSAGLKQLIAAKEKEAEKRKKNGTDTSSNVYRAAIEEFLTNDYDEKAQSLIGAEMQDFDSRY